MYRPTLFLPTPQPAQEAQQHRRNRRVRRVDPGHTAAAAAWVATPFSDCVQCPAGALVRREKVAKKTNHSFWDAHPDNWRTRVFSDRFSAGLCPFVISTFDRCVAPKRGGAFYGIHLLPSFPKGLLARKARFTASCFFFRHRRAFDELQTLGVLTTSYSPFAPGTWGSVVLNPMRGCQFQVSLFLFLFFSRGSMFAWTYDMSWIFEGRSV